MSAPAAWACAQVVHRFFQHLDERRAEAAAELFVEDGIWIRPNGRLQGRPAVLRAVASRPTDQVSRHLVTNIVVDGDSARAEARYYVLVFSHTGDTTPPAPLGGAHFILVCEDVLVAGSDGWRFAQRSAQVVFAAGG